MAARVLYAFTSKNEEAEEMVSTDQFLRDMLSLEDHARRARAVELFNKFSGCEKGLLPRGTLLGVHSNVGIRNSGQVKKPLSEFLAWLFVVSDNPELKELADLLMASR